MVSNQTKDLSTKIIATVALHEASKRLDVVLSTKEGVSSRAIAKKIILNGLIQVNGKKERIEPDTVTNAGDILEYNLPPVAAFELTPISKELEIHFEDDELLVVYKPAGVVTHPAVGHFDESLVHYLAAHTKLAESEISLRPGIVHRLDKDTSGLLVVAKTANALSNLSKQFANKQAFREYYALVFGLPVAISSVIDKPIGRHPINRKKQAVVAKGKKSTTHIYLIESVSPFSLLKCKLETGRTHQIRVHLSSVFLPIVGDKVYGKTNFRFDKAKLSEQKKIALDRLTHQCLHAYKIGFTHPITGQKLLFERDLPENFKFFLDAFGFKFNFETTNIALAKN